MKKRWSLKSRLTLWMTFLLTTMAALVGGIMLFISSRVSVQDAHAGLAQAMGKNLMEVTENNGSPSFSQNFQFYQNGVYILVYNQSGALLAGQPPLGFSTDIPFENGLSRLESCGDEHFYVLDVHRPFNWEKGVWIRAVSATSGSQELVLHTLNIMLMAFPFLIALGAAGSYLLARRALQPIETITATADEIGAGADLSRRIGLPENGDELCRLGGVFDGMLARLETAFEEESRFAADASHELRTPLSVILTQCEYSKRHGEELEEYQEALEVIDRQAHRMRHLVEELLNMTRLAQGTQRLELEDTNLSELTEAVCGDLNIEKGISLSVDVEPELFVRVDHGLYHRLLQNLLENGIKYGREGGHLWVGLHRENGEAVLTVRDDGLGIAPEQQEKIWRRFYQVDPARSRQNGAGLGLALVRQIAALLQGRVELESTLGEGSMFTVTLPLGKE